MLDCPSCKKPVDGLTCPFCGYSELPAIVPGQVARDPDWWRCCHEDRGQRCANAGSISPSTHGQTTGTKSKSGPWYCWQHVPAMQQFKDGVRSPPPEGFFAGWRKKLGPRPVDFEAEAERVALQNEPAP